MEIQLPNPRGFRGLSLEEAIIRRRSHRAFDPAPISLSILSRLLFAAQGVTDPESGLRAAPSAGALFPIETYVVVNHVDEIAQGIYRYLVGAHALTPIRQGDFSEQIMRAALNQEFVARASICVILAAIFQRMTWKYRDRTYRYILLEAGHIGQNIYLAATSMGLGACAVGAFYDDLVNDLLGIDGEDEATVYLLAVGRKTQTFG